MAGFGHSELSHGHASADQPGLFDLGLPSMVGKLLFIVGRVAGLSAEVLEEYTREKPMRITIPVEYDGVPPLQNEQ